MINDNTKKFYDDIKARILWTNLPLHITNEGLTVGSQQVIQMWEKPIMEIMGRIVADRGGDILEIGFGLGLAAKAITSSNYNSYTVIEAHPLIAEMARRWVSSLPRPGRVIEGFWQDIVHLLPDNSFNGILFDTCPIHEEDRNIWYKEFIPYARRLLKPGGIFTYFSNQSANEPLRDLDVLKQYFEVIEPAMSVEVRPYKNCQYWQSENILVPIIRN